MRVYPFSTLPAHLQIRVMEFPAPTALLAIGLKPIKISKFLWPTEP